MTFAAVPRLKDQSRHWARSRLLRNVEVAAETQDVLRSVARTLTYVPLTHNGRTQPDGVG